MLTYILLLTNECKVIPRKSIHKKSWVARVKLLSNFSDLHAGMAHRNNVVVNLFEC